MQNFKHSFIEAAFRIQRAEDNVNSVDPDEVAHYLQIQLFSFFCA